MGSRVSGVMGFFSANFQLATRSILDLGSDTGKTDRRTGRQQPSTHHAPPWGRSIAMVYENETLLLSFSSAQRFSFYFKLIFTTRRYAYM